jgi:hypothetical protein
VCCDVRSPETRGLFIMYYCTEYVDIHKYKTNKPTILISGFRPDVDEICALLGYYAASCGNCLPTFRDNVSVPSSRFKSPRKKGTRTLDP